MAQTGHHMIVQSREKSPYFLIYCIQLVLEYVRKGLRVHVTSGWRQVDHGTHAVVHICDEYSKIRHRIKRN